jgi:hypothetical protein
LEQGLAELIGYLSLREPGFAVVFDEERRERIEWCAEDVDRIAELPRVNFTRARPAPKAGGAARPVPDAIHTARSTPGPTRSENP